MSLIIGGLAETIFRPAPLSGWGPRQHFRDKLLVPLRNKAAMLLHRNLEQQKFPHPLVVANALRKHVKQLADRNGVVSWAQLRVNKVRQIVDHAFRGCGLIGHDTASLIGMTLAVAAAGEAQNVAQWSIKCWRLP
jgi:hypothetical protein